MLRAGKFRSGKTLDVVKSAAVAQRRWGSSSNGLELENHGVIPDHQCIPSGRDLREERDLCLWKAVELARAELKLNEDPTIREVKKMVGTHQ